MWLVIVLLEAIWAPEAEMGLPVRSLLIEDPVMDQCKVDLMTVLMEEEVMDRMGVVMVREVQTLDRMKVLMVGVVLIWDPMMVHMVEMTGEDQMMVLTVVEEDHTWDLEVQWDLVVLIWDLEDRIGDPVVQIWDPEV